MISNNFEARVTMVMDTIMFMIFFLCVFLFFQKKKKKIMVNFHTFILMKNFTFISLIKLSHKNNNIIDK